MEFQEVILNVPNTSSEGPYVFMQGQNLMTSSKFQEQSLECSCKAMMGGMKVGLC